ncbi:MULTISPECIES: TonB-dependent receptor [unclassified Duganella]|uniref:TonB-dependent receptor n=1 Tax=unclassified Duganella TaxID=2636909 RepID=UPI000E34BCD9|nr:MULTISPECIES: TonB-dependent receptor [unclassified Duganella]RFP18702.1 TonB-dependent receptor [Duganella sp. BJB475]RFP35367.1 TonB-dependent receptor [Duganella sp. BJB476]
MQTRPFQHAILPALISQLFLAPAYAADPADPAPSGDAIQVIVVDAQRATNSNARQAQEQAPNLINLMTAAEMRKLPDVNIAESVRRIPGISLETDTGEGRFVNIRGLDADLNSTTFGGLRLPPSNNATPFGGGRAVALDAIPTGLVGAITVTKSNLPEQDAEALGGTIEITPKTAPRNGKPFLEARIGTGRESLRGTNIADLSLTAGTRFGAGDAGKGGAAVYSDHPFSIVVTAAYYEDKRGIDDVEPAFLDDGVHAPLTYAGWDQRWYQYHRRRHGVGIDLGYQPDARNSYYIRGFDAGYTESVQRQRLTVTPDGAPVATASGFIDGMGANGFDKTLRDEQETINNKIFVAGGKNQLEHAVLDYRLGYTRGSYNKMHDYNSDFNYTPSGAATVSYANSGPGNVPAFTVNGADYLNPANYALVKFQNSTTDISDHEWSVAANLRWDTRVGGYEEESFKAGASARLRKRVVNGQPYSYANLPALPLTAASAGPGIAFYDGLYQNGPQLTPGLLQNLYGSKQFVSGSDAQNAALQYLQDKEDVYAGYGQYQMRSGPLGVTGGLRVEATRANYAANAKGTDADGNTLIQPDNRDRNYVNWFPSVQARYELDASTLLRAAFSSTIARPGFSQVSAALNIDPGANTVTRGNPDLKPTTANSFDLSFERYLPNAGIASIGIFDKEISNYIAASQTSQTFPNHGLFAGFVGVAHVYSFANVGKSVARGLELNYEQRFTTLPGWLGGLGASANYTFVDSHFEIRPGETSTLPSTSRNTVNAAVFYEAGPWNLRLGMYALSRNLWAIGGSAALDVYSERRTSYDFGGSYALNKHVSLYLNAKNLSDTPLKFAEGTSQRTIQREYYGATYQAGVNLTY